MSYRKLKAGSTSKTAPIFVQDTSSTTGGGLSGLVFNTSNLAAKYRREGQATWTTISLVTATVGTWTSGGFVTDGGPVTGTYELGIPDAVLAAGATWAEVVLYGAANMLPVLILFELDVLDYQDGTRAGLLALPAANANAAGGLPISAAGALDLDEMNVDIEAIQTGVAAIPTGDAFARLGAPAGASIAADIAAVKSDTGTILNDVNTGAGAIYNRLGAPAGASIAADLAEIEAETDALLTGTAPSWFPLHFTNATFASDGVFATAALANAPGGGGSLTAGQIWDLASSGHTTPGTFGALVSAAGSSADPLLNTVPGSYASGTAGYALGRIGSGQIVTVGNVSQDGSQMRIVRGADYYAADGNAFSWTDADGVWPSLAGGSARLYIWNGATWFGKALTVTGSTHQTLTAELSKVETTALPKASRAFQIWLTLADGHTFERIAGTASITDGVT